MVYLPPNFLLGCTVVRSCVISSYRQFCRPFWPKLDLLTIISVVYRFPPSLVSHGRVWIRPSTKSGSFPHVLCQIGRLPKATQLWIGHLLFRTVLVFPKFGLLRSKSRRWTRSERLELGVSGQVSVDLCVIYVHGFYWLE